MHSPAEFEACIAALWVFPIKSCAGISVQQAVLTPAGLAHDRAWMVVDTDGEMVTQRELPRMALIQPELVNSGVGLAELVLHGSGLAALHLPLTVGYLTEAHAIKVRVWDDQVPAFDMGAEVSKWLTEFLGSSLGPLRLVRFDPKHRRPSNTKWTQGLTSLNQFSDGFPVLVASTASLHELNARLQDQGHAVVDMRRFRANVVLSNVEASSGHAIHAVPLNAHDEDRISTMTIHTQAADTHSEAAQLTPVKPCPRCPIPNIDPDSAQSHSAVSDTLQAYRQDPRVNGALTFGMNCVPVSGVGQMLRVGQRVSADWGF
jgi:uncharacterized protein YcbX